MKNFSNGNNIKAILLFFVYMIFKEPFILSQSTVTF